MLTKKQYNVIALLFEGKTQKKIADILNISDRTIRRWSKTPEFKEAIRTAGLEYISNQIPELVRNMTKLAYKSKSDFVRLQATQDMLNRISLVEKEENKEAENVERIIEAYQEAGKLIAAAKVDTEASPNDS
jgi:predicted transcriptional regulator